MRVENWPIERVKPYENNPRQNDEAVPLLGRSRSSGSASRLSSMMRGVIIVGHTRWKAAQQLGMKKVPVQVAKGFTPAQIKA